MSCKRHSYRQLLATSNSVDSKCSRKRMLRRMALASAKILANLQTPSRRSSLLCIKDALQVPALSRSLTGGEVREAARNAKAYLLRAHAASSQATDAQTAAPAQSSFLNLSVDDRVVVSPAAHLFGVMVRSAIHIMACELVFACRAACRKTMCRSQLRSKRLPYLLSFRVEM